MEIRNHGEDSASAAIEEVPATEWKEEVYGPDIQEMSASLYKRAEYTM